MREYKYMPLSLIRAKEKEMASLKVSEVARSRRGFLTQFKRVNGNPDSLPDYWKIKRHGFIKRHMVQYEVNPTKRRRLALNAWAYDPK